MTKLETLNEIMDCLGKANDLIQDLHPPEDDDEYDPLAEPYDLIDSAGGIIGDLVLDELKLSVGL